MRKNFGGQVPRPLTGPNGIDLSINDSDVDDDLLRARHKKCHADETGRATGGGEGGHLERSLFSGGVRISNDHRSAGD